MLWCFGVDKVKAYIGFSIFIFATYSFAGENSFSPKPYIGDYLALREHISKSYANLEYLIQYYKINPYELNQKTIAAINSAKSDEEARAALNEFVKTFNDGHFQLKKPEADHSGVAAPPSPIGKYAKGEAACKAMDFTWDKNFAFRFPAGGVKAIKKGGGEFPFLVAETNGIKIGIIRIADFRDEVYPRTCIEVWEKYAKTLKTYCDEKCRNDFLHKEMRKALVDKFYVALNKVKESGIKALVVDLTGNGGGTDWVTDITALVTDKRLVCGRRGFIKHSHYVKIFADDLNELRAAPEIDSKKIRAVEAKLKLASETCDRTPLWTRRDFKLSCSGIAYSEGDSCKYGDLKFKGKRKYNGKLFLLVDNHTASAAEDIVARHLDSKAAIVIGGHTHGSGCGYMNGGIKFKLPYTGLIVSVPDCVRERADGTNEVIGIEPQIKLDMSKIGDPAFLGLLLDTVVAQMK
jgi:hypothetical protein